MIDGSAPRTGRQPSDLFVGREPELDELLSGLDAVAAGRGRLFLVGGEPGIGKSRLADEVASRAQERGLRVLSGRAWEDAGAPPYWPWVQVFRTIIRTTEDDVLRHQLGAQAADIAQMVVDLRETLGDVPVAADITSESARFQLFDSSTTFLRRAARATPMLIVIDDLHAADMPTIRYLRFVASQLADTPVMVICTYREMEVAADPALATELGAIARLPGTLTVSLGGLTEESVRELIEATTGVSPRANLVHAIVRETNGNPLFLGEALRLLAAEGRLREVATGQTLDLPLPAGIRDVILRRVSHLPAETAELLMHAAALGPEFITEVLRRVTDASSASVLDRIGEASRAGLVAPVPGTLGRFRFTHDLIRETLYDELAPGRRLELHRRIADTLQDMHGSAPEGYLAELAHHYVEASRGGEPDEPSPHGSTVELAIRYAREAGDVALRSLAYEEAARLYRMALAVLELHAPGDAERHVETLLRLGEAEARAGDLPASRDTYLGAAKLARRIGAAESLARAALGYGGRFFWARVGHDPHLVPLLQDALLLLGGADDRLRVRLLTRLACAWRSEPDRQEQRRALAQQAVDMARQLDDAATLGYALVGFFWAVWLPDNADERLATATEMLAVADAAGDAERLIDANLMLVLVHIDMGRMSTARARMEAVITLARQLRQPAQLWVTRAVRTLFALMDGRFAEAEELLSHEIAPGYPTTPIQDDVSAMRMHRWLLRREQGRGGEEEATVRASAEEFPWYPLHRAALACLLADDERTDEAQAVLDELAADSFRALYPDCEWLLGMALAGEACAMLGDTAAAAVLYDQLLPFAGGHAVGHTEGSVGAVDRYLGLLAATLGRDVDAERHLETAIIVNEKLGAVPFAAHAQADLAALLTRRGTPADQERAGTLRRTALDTARRLGMVALEQRLVGTVPDAGTVAPPTRPTDGDPGAVFRREGEYWTVAFDGHTFRMRDAKGMRYLARLLARPGQELHAVDLARSDADPSPAKVALDDAQLVQDGGGGVGPALDAEAEQQYRDRLRELRGAMDAAQDAGDDERVERLQAEVDAIVGELSAAFGLGGRARQKGSHAERARQSVTKAVRDAVRRIGKEDAALGEHLARTVRTGLFCIYDPDPAIARTWETDPRV